ncbi:heme-binding protein [Enterocloster clostridioformis]|uniref:heme-binding protein n=1 Tax=Enterocloster clostridioformis TaxID=1531 RepID=UPI0026760BC0|nr:heme-binding protein [Enterocloster clostridioformis]
MSNELEILTKQEALLQFPKFDQGDAYELEKFMVEYARSQNIVIAVSIRMGSGSIVFQYLPDGTNLLNQKWMERKYNTVRLTEDSSLMASLKWEEAGETPKIHGLSEEEYALCGGGFPIRIKGSKPIVGVILASNLFHIADHEFIINCLREYLNCPEAPTFPYTCP